ncbi:leucine-rich repeat domain-containing protein [endosymbiont GvMRE of Glomus versiforme]|uniref:leucine-rich repeat domain-containing protein n=1 Tax=endosymbiont GvMRE of Glomus versiforme TaxID=2039283 RepID=UPI0015596381|nr:leucine-rich repeat domain-containing protein [endosymbiont GvMRE of Glomus versiforme]
MVIQAQNWLNQNYPKEIGNQIKNLYIREKELEGHLDLRGFTNLEKLDCSYNQITSLDLTGLKQLRTVYCNNNLLNSLDYSSLNPKSLTGLIIDNNNLPEQDLAVFSQFINLEDLRIGSNDKEKIAQGIYNRFSGSLKSLKNLANLRDLDISNTDINGNVDFLPDSIRRVSYSSKERPESKLREISGQLDSFLSSRNFKENWKDIHPEFVDKFKQNQWEKLGFNYQQVKDWIKVGLQPDDHHFVAHLRAKGYNPQQNLNLEELKKKSRNVQEWLEQNYPLEERRWLRWLVIDRRSGLEGGLVVENFPNLEILDCYCNPLTSLTLSNLPKLTRVSCPDSTINQLTINNCPGVSNLNVTNNSLVSLDFLDNLDSNKLAFLYITNNSFPRQDIDIFSKFVNLERFYLANNSFYGSLQSLRSLTRLKKLGTSGTEISGGYEYLPNNCEFTLDLKEKTTDLKPVGLWGSLSKNEENVVTYYDLQYWKENQPPYKLLKETLEKIDPSQNIWDFLGRRGIFFNVRTGTFEGDLQFLASSLKTETILKDQEKKIDYLESRVQELTEASKKQKDKIIASLLQVFPEKELLQELIKIHLEFTKAKKQKRPVIKLRKQKEEVYSELEKKLENSEETMEKIEAILTDCEELVAQELELEAKLDNKTSLIESQKQILSETPNNKEKEQKVHQLELELVKVKAELDAKKEENNRLWEQLNKPTINIVNVNQLATGDNSSFSNQVITNYQTKYIQNYQQLAEETGKEIEFLDIKEITPQEKQVINKTIIFLGTKELFINYRQEVINHLIDSYCKLAGKNNSTKFVTFNSMMGITSKLTNVIPGGGVVETPLGILGDTINLAGTVIQEKNLKKCLKKFQEVFDKDKESLSLFDESYRSLIQTIWSGNEQGEITRNIIDTFRLDKTQLRSFSDNYNVFKVGEVWEKNLPNLNLEELKAFLEKIDSSLSDFRQKFQQQKKNLAEKSWFKAVESQTDLLQNQQQAQILQPAYGIPGPSK